MPFATTLLTTRITANAGDMKNANKLATITTPTVVEDMKAVGKAKQVNTKAATATTKMYCSISIFKPPKILCFH